MKDAGFPEPDIRGYECDTSSEEMVTKTWNQIVKDFKKVDVLVSKCPFLSPYFWPASSHRVVRIKAKRLGEDPVFGSAFSARASLTCSDAWLHKFHIIALSPVGYLKGASMLTGTDVP